MLVLRISQSMLIILSPHKTYEILSFLALTMLQNEQ